MVVVPVVAYVTSEPERSSVLVPRFDDRITEATKTACEPALRAQRSVEI
jgi:hypothetical protein